MKILEFLKTNLRESLLKGIDETIFHLKKLLDEQSDKLHTLILLEVRFEDVKKKSIAGTATEEEKQLEINRIRESLMNLINSLQAHDVDYEEKIKENTLPNVHVENVYHTKANQSFNQFSNNDINKGHVFNAKIISRKNNEYLSIVASLHHQEHLIEYKIGDFGNKLVIDQVEVSNQNDLLQSVGNAFLLGLTFGLVNNSNKKTFIFNLSDKNINYPSSLEFNLGIYGSFSSIIFKVDGITLINE